MSELNPQFTSSDGVTVLVPLVHLNGTSVNSLLDAVGEAGSTLLDAKRKFDDMAPNGRDYYPYGPTAIQRAEEEWKRQRDALLGVLKYIAAQAEYLCGVQERGQHTR